MTWVRTEVPLMHRAVKKVNRNEYVTECGQKVRPILVVETRPPQTPACAACSTTEGSIGSEHGTDTVPVEEAHDG